MSVLYIVLPLALLFAGGAVVVFIWATRRGQFDDLETPARRLLFDDDRAPVGRALVKGEARDEEAPAP